MKQKVAILSKEVQIADEKAKNMDRFLRIAGKYEGLRELTPAILRELIEKIVVHEPIHVDNRKRVQKLQIYYNFIGAIAAPEKEKAESA